MATREARALRQPGQNLVGKPPVELTLLPVGGRELRGGADRRGVDDRADHPAVDPAGHLLAGVGHVGRLPVPRWRGARVAKQFFDPADIRNNLTAGGGGLYDIGSYAISGCNQLFKRPSLRVVAALERDPVFHVDRLTSALLDDGDGHAAFTVATQSGSSAWGSHQQLSVLGANGWLRFDFPFAQARPVACRLEMGDATSVGAIPTRTFAFEPAISTRCRSSAFPGSCSGMPLQVGRSRTHWSHRALSRHCLNRLAKAAGRP